MKNNVLEGKIKVLSSMMKPVFFLTHVLIPSLKNVFIFLLAYNTLHILDKGRGWPQPLATNQKLNNFSVSLWVKREKISIQSQLPLRPVSKKILDGRKLHLLLCTISRHYIP